MEFKDLVGMTLVNVTVNDDKDVIEFITKDERVFQLYHEQDCCECVLVEDVCGCLDDLISGGPLVIAEEARFDATGFEDGGDGSSTWTFYKLDTVNGGVTIRWLSSSNGYYSESVDFREVVKEGKDA